MIRGLARSALPVVALLVGAFLYLGWRSDLRMHGWFDVARLPELCRNASQFIPISSWIRWSLPDGLWQFAFSYWTAQVWSGRSGRERWFWLCLPMVIGLGSELGQLFHWIPGVYDETDLLLIALGGIGGLALGLWVPSARFHPARVEQER